MNTAVCDETRPEAAGRVGNAPEALGSTEKAPGSVRKRSEAMGTGDAVGSLGKLREAAGMKTVRNGPKRTEMG